ncbi:MULTISPECIES: glycosyltransferase family 4 protein [unclassified Coleofasciculus]|uniref:glycosyltransferase family 4 protein n=1 Tax=unclassified Coleofasciculus TaxID=2692782 RepID=UPI001880D903|nr:MULTISPECIES: glycosyltransferase [unclassified Coleofasciculus]MBE9126903.1 glycosyltransferase [Coleofasciculus sp. LEGE 07081]MBE9150201.1 glycosyltransferase [Coleofasciculus sp. LEGE 07092]
MIFNGFYILSTEPLIVSYIGDLPALSQGFMPKHVLQNSSGFAARWKRMLRHKKTQVLHSMKSRKHHFIVNASEEEVWRKKWFMRGAHFNHNIYVNEYNYKPLNEPKYYDAIYIGQLKPFKRHWLAKDIERLMIASYGGDLPAFCPELAHAEYNREFIPRPELAKKINQAYVGLCLSAEEGAMFASMEYLLCGIPVVSTPSKGGRDEFFNQENSIIVPPQADAVAQAVKRWQESPPNPHKIREQTLKQVNTVRLSLCTYVAKLIEQEGGSKKDPEELLEKYFAAPGISSRFVHQRDLANIDLEQFRI